MDKKLKEQYPHIPLEYLEEIEKELDLCEQKNKDYNNQGDLLGNFERIGSILALYPNLKLNKTTSVAIILMLKQLDCILHMLDLNYDGDVESLESRARDLTVYSKFILLLHQRERKKREKREKKEIM